MHRIFLISFLAFAAMSCKPPRACGDRESCTDQKIRSWVSAADPKPWAVNGAGWPVAVYADRSGSMAGFLDPAYPTRTDYRSVIDGLQARLAPRVVYGFGTAVRRELQPGLGVMGNRAWYADRNTETDEVLDSIAADSAHAATHLVVTDGRRSDPDRANGQFVHMREVADAWVRAGGSFMVAVTQAPFTPVKDDPSGCHAQGRVAAADTAGAAGRGLTCPLYVFAFAAPGDGMRVGQTLAQLFDHLWMYPTPTAPGRMFVLSQSGAADGAITFDRQRLATDGDSAAVAAVEAAQPATQPLRLHLDQPDTASPAGRLVAALLASGTRAELAARGITADSAAAPWLRVDGSTGAVRVDAAGRALQVFSPGGDDCRAAAEEDPCGTLYRVELFPTGTPAWIADLEARDARDAERTFGLGRLFERFRANAAATPPLARAYLLVR